MASRYTRLWLALLSYVVCSSSVALYAQDPAENDERLRRQVLSSIERAQRFLVDSQNSDGTWSAGLYSSYSDGVNGLVTLAMLNSGLPSNHPAVAKALDRLEHPQTDPKNTYDIAMVIMALAASDRGRGKIATLARKLEEGQRTGADGGNWGYTGKSGSWDNSNTQFAVLGLREAAYVGIPIDRAVWRRSQEHFLRTQQGNRNSPSGAGWAYTGEGSAYGSMTVAGLASLVITHEMLQDDSDVSPNGEINCCAESSDEEAEEAINAGIRWLNTNLRIESNPGGQRNWLLYYLYGLERAGRFTGRRFFGQRDWYREGAVFLVERQDIRNGSWVSAMERHEVTSTSLALLFLSKGLSPVLINKLKYGPREPRTGEVVDNNWNRHPRDVDHLTTFISKLDGWPPLLTWQVVDLRTAAQGEGVAALLQAPVQLLSGAQSPDTIQGRELELLRSYLAQGGFLFAVNNCDSPEFDRGFRDLVRRLFDGQSELVKLPSTHDIYRSEFPFLEGGAELWGVDFGCRTAIVYSPNDLACRWNKWMLHEPDNRLPAVRTQVNKALQLGTNVIAYATGREVLDKLERPKILAAGAENQMTRGRLSIGRLRHTGGWDTAPNALRRLTSALETVGIEAASQTPNLPANDPALFDYPLLYMHGRRNYQLSDEELTGLKQYLGNGGFLFADACCGAEQFDQSFRQMVQQLYGQPLERIPVEHELYRMGIGFDIRRVSRRIPAEGANVSSLETRESIGEPILEGLQLNGKYVIVYSKYDLSCALERQATTACAGYSTQDAVKIGVNLVLYGLFQ